MYDKVEKYIYKIGSDNYRLKIQKYDKETGVELKISENHKKTLEEVIDIRDKYLEDYEDKIKLKKVDVIPDNSNDDETVTTKKKSKKTKKQEFKKIDTYIYQSSIANKKFKILIKKGTKGEIGYFYFSKVIDGTISEARKLRDKKLAEYKLNQTTSNDKGNISLLDFSKIFLENHYKNIVDENTKNGNSPTTYDGVVSKLNCHILPELGKYKLNKIDTFLLQKFVNSLMNKKKSVKGKENETISSTTANDIYRVLRNMLNRAVDWEYIDKNPLLKVKAPPVADTEKETFTKEEMIDVLSKLKNEPVGSKCIFIIAMATGLRRGEILGLHLDNINLEDESLNVVWEVVRSKKMKKLIEKSPKTGKSVREVPIPPFCVEAIKEYLEWRTRKVERLKVENPKLKEKPNLFLGEDGGFMRPEFPTKKWGEFIKKNGYKNVTLHGLRHSYSTLQMNDNPELGPTDVAELLGHTQLSTTFHYSRHKRGNKRKETLAIFNDFNKGDKFTIQQVISVCTGRKYASTSEISNILNYMVPDEEISVNNKVRMCRSEIFKKYPKLSEIDDNGVNVNNIFDWLEEQQNKFGNQFLLEPINEIEISKQKDLQNPVELL